MSDQMTGADLEQLDALSTAYATAGAQITARGDDLRRRIGVAVTNFGATMTRLQQQSQSLTDATDAEIAAVGATAASVLWTGTNRHAFDGELQQFSDAVRRSSVSFNASVSELRGAVDARFNPELEAFGVAIGSSAGGVDATTGDMRATVATQRSALEQAANVGWTSA